MTGALNLLRNVETIDWTALYSGEICMDELQRVRRVARRDIVSLPTFLADVDKYRQQLREIAVVNGLQPHGFPSTVNVELAVSAPPRSRQRITAKLTVAPAPRHAMKPVNAAPPAVIPAVRFDVGNSDQVEKISRGKDELLITGSAIQATGLRMASITAKRLAKMHKECELSTFVDGRRPNVCSNIWNYIGT